MAKFHFSFGMGYDLSDAVIVIEAPTEQFARERFVKERIAAGLEPIKGWSSVYDEEGFAEYNAKYGPFREVPIDTPARGSD
jgi:hypothetical protein